ncbi:MAG TPA: right-handed parallel beta-helix repeat-containing protein [Bacteroidales bacterium]|nr:right-handed parallel beta-helix repeat-containing protein [Bacteroidales bacterium]
MKRIVFLTIFSLVSTVIYSQLSGDGSYSNPWSGTLDGDMTWSGTKYINGDITVDNETLTISPGAIIIFLAEGADLIITGTGKLVASGSASSMITFTADDDNDGNYGETGERWGHIWFNAPSESNASSIEYCIIEYGDVHLFTDYRGYGGAIHADFSNLTISHSILRNNYGYWGGAIFINKDKGPSINNCYIINNQSSRGGGGIYCWDKSNSVISNCIFESNACLEPSTEYYSGGGLCAQTSTSIKVINSTFVNNTTKQANGAGIEFYISNNAKIINSIFWGSDNQVYLRDTKGNTVINCAIQSIIPSGSVNCIVLNASNSDPSGPNFTNPSNSDWSLQFISPCRDAGVNSYTGVIIPSTDYLGNSTIYNKDIGAYEVQYSRWKTDPSDKSTWNAPGNWEQGIHPSHANATGDVLIPALASSSIAPDVSNVTVPSGKYMVLEPGAKATISTLTNNGTLFLRSNASQRSSLITDSYSGNDAVIEIFLSGGGTEEEDNFKWHYIASPVSSLPVSVFSAVTPDVAQFVESRPTMDLMQGWVAYDGYVYSTGLTNGPTFSTLTTGTNGKGYNYFDYNDHLFTFTGSLNTSDVVAPLGFSGNPSLHGFNLLGNPFMSGLDWDYIVNDPGYPANTSKGVYFTRDNVQCTYINGVGIPGDVTGIIPPMQGFFTKTYSTGNSITLSASARTHDNIHPYYKGSGNTISLVRLALQGNEQTDETVVRFDDYAKSSLDNDFDMVKMIMSGTRTQIYTSLDAVDYAINGLPFPETKTEIPVVVILSAPGSYTINALQIQNLPEYNVRLKDLTAGVTVDLRETPEYIFSDEAGKIAGRFILEVSNISTGIESPAAGNEDFRIYTTGGILNIIPLSQTWDGKIGSVRIIDLNGRIIHSVNSVYFHSGTPLQIKAPEQSGLYFVDIRTGLLKHIARFIVKQ